MARYAGVWIDHRQAVVVLASDGAEEVHEVSSEAHKPPHATGTSHTNKPEGTQERKYASELNVYYDAVIALVKNAADVLVFGPGEAKKQFSKRLQEEESLGPVVEVETTDKMTIPQIAVHVRKHFGISG